LEVYKQCRYNMLLLQIQNDGAQCEEDSLWS
jgi:hypothetical protein